MTSSHVAIWIIAAVATAGVSLRPFRLPEAIWAVSGAVLLLMLGLIAPADAIRGVANGADVYLFLLGMILLAEIARIHGLFDWLAAHATQLSKGSAHRLFLLTYVVGTIVTAFLSNDATAVVLTPAVAAAVKAAKADDPLPYLLICAFVANAASFVLPISNPANLVIYRSLMPPLAIWLARFLLPSLLSIVATFFVLRWTQRRALRQGVAVAVNVPILTRGGQAAGVGVVITAAVLITSSALGAKLGLPTAIAGIVTVLVVLIIEQRSPWTLIKDVSWSVLPLVAGLFVLVEALEQSGLIQMISQFIRGEAQAHPTTTGWSAGIVVALASNLINNLPASLIAGTAIQTAQASPHLTSAVLIGVDLGPNLSVTGSLATILWLGALRREGIVVNGRTFLKVGLLVMPPALTLALLGSFLSG
jgi:arsenical pump membrane protein